MGLRFDARLVNVVTAGSRVQVLNSTRRVRWIQFLWDSANAGAVYVGDSNVASNRGYELSSGHRSVEYDFAKVGGSVPINVFYVDAANNNEDVRYAVIYDA